MRRAVLAALVTLAFTAAGCGNDADDSAGPTTTSANTTSTTTTSTTSTTSAPDTTTTVTTTEAPLPAIASPPASTVAGILALDHPVVIGHAGGDLAWPHSTMFAFSEAARTGSAVLEMDVQLTADGVLVVQHDDTVDRTTEITGRVRDLTLDELQALDNGFWWSGEWGNHDLPDDAYIYRGIRTGDRDAPPGYSPEHFRVETFRSIAEAFPEFVLDVEIKIPDGDDGEADVTFAIDGARVLAEEIDELGRTDSVVVVSFDDDVMAAFREFAPGVVTSPGTTAMFSWVVGSAELAPTDLILQLPPEFNGIDVLGIDGLLEKAAAQSLAIWVWPNDVDTQENPDFYAGLLDLGIAGVIAGHPEQAVERFRADGDIPG